VTINSLSLVHSTPFTGLGTQTYNVPATGLYTMQVSITIPWLSSDQPVAVANPLAREVQTITTVADSAGSLNSTFWTFRIAGNITGYYVWYNINSAGVDPAPAGLAAIAVAGATNATASTLGGATRTAIAAATTGVAVSGPTSGVILTNATAGSCTAAADGTAATSFTFAVGTTGSYGYASGLNVIGYHNSTSILVLNQPTPSQPSLSGSAVVQCTAADTLTVVLASLANADNALNAVKGVLNIYLGE
jgi:hypothetical protein